METQRFDHLWNDLLHQHALTVSHLNGEAKHRRLARQAAYRFARTLIVIQDHCFNEFRDLIKSHSVNVDDWLDEKFFAIEAAGGDRRKLLTGIRNGMTEDQFIVDGDTFLIRKHSAKKNHQQGTDDSTDEDDQPQIPTLESDPPEVRIRALSGMLESAQSEIRQLRRENRVQAGHIANLLRELAVERKRADKAVKLLSSASNRKVG